MTIVERTAPLVMAAILSLTVTAVLALVGQAIFNWGLADLFHVRVSYKEAFGLMMIARYCRI